MSSKGSYSEYVSGLRQLLENLDPVIRQADSAAAIEEILLNLETTDENFHKYELVKMLRKLIEDELGPLANQIVQETESEMSSNHSNLTLTINDEVLTSNAFSNLIRTTVKTIKSAANEIMQSLPDSSTNQSFGFSSSDHRQRFSYGGPNSYGKDSFLTSSFDGDDYMFMSPEKYGILANQLSAESSLSKKLDALNTLAQVPQTDLVNSEYWSIIKSGLLAALKANEFALSDKSLKFHAKMFATPSGHVAKEIYTSLSSHLIDYFQDATYHFVFIDSGLDLGDKRNMKLMKEFRLLNQFQHELPLGWIRYPENLVVEILQSTVRLMSIIPKSISTGQMQGILGPLNFLSLIDPSAFWFCKWMHGKYSRSELIRYLGETKHIVKEACKSCVDFALHCKVQSAMSSMEEDEHVLENDDDADALVYSKPQLLCAYFIQSINILGRIILYKDGRKLFPLELEERLETITIPDLLVAFVEVISFIPIQSNVDPKNVNEVDPAKLAADIIKMLASGTAETCIDCLCKDTVTAALLVPVQRWLDGYVGMYENDKQNSEQILIIMADILAVIAATEFGRLQLLYGEQPERWQRSRLAPIHTIALFTKKSLSGKLDPQPSQDVISAYLFVCRQLYNTCEGLMTLNSYGLSICIKTALDGLKEPVLNTKRVDAFISKSKWHRAMSISSTNTEDVPESLLEDDDMKLAFLNSGDNETESKGDVDNEDKDEEDTLVEFSQSVTPSQNLQNTKESQQHIESLIDNLLNFMSTPKGVLLVQQSGLIAECAQFMQNRYKQNLQVSKTEKFGYGAMMAQITATAPGMLALEKSGFFRCLLSDTWKCLEGVTNDYQETVLTPYWDDFNDKYCKKYFTIIINLLSAFTSTYELLNIPSSNENKAENEIENEFVAEEETLTDNHQALNDLAEPVTTENAPGEPESFQELLKNLVFVDSSEKMRVLFHFERSHLFGLRILSSLVTCLDTFLLLQSKYGFQEILLRLQASNKLDDDANYIIDNCSVERNQILVRTYIIGGPTERVIPARTLTQEPSNPYPWPLFSSFPIPSDYTPHESNHVMTAFEQPDEVCRFLTETEPEAFNTLDETHDWLSRCRAVFVSSLRNGSETVGLKFASQLVERVCDALCQDPEESILPLVEYSGNETLLQNITLSDVDRLGTEMVIRYGASLRLIPHAADVDKQFTHLLKQCKYFLSSQQRSFTSSMQSLQNGYVGFDWFLGSIYLLMNGKTDKVWDFLYRFSTLVASGYLWTPRLHASVSSAYYFQASKMTRAG
eukprot:gene5435-6114_t